MPVNVDKNLTLKNNTMDASYGELFKKLNKAYAWTNTQTTSSGGTAVVIVNDGDILTTMECNDIDKCVCGNICKHAQYSIVGQVYTLIINGKFYYYNNGQLTQYGSKSNYKEVCSQYAIDTDGKLWYVTSSSETQIGTDTKWEKLGYSYSTSGIAGICDGKLYKISGTNTLARIGDYENIIFSDIFSYSYGYFITSNGDLYCLSNNTIVDSSNAWKYVYSIQSNSSSINGFGITTTDEVYLISTGVLSYKQNITNVKKIVYPVFLTNDNKIYISLDVFSSSNRYIDISNGISWTDISFVNDNTFYGIGDGKLYKIKFTNSSTPTTTYTQIGTESNYQKIGGSYYNSSSPNYYIALAWTGDATTVSHTVLTTKSPQVNDAAYIDEDLNQYSTIQSVGGVTVTDQYRTYNRDVSKDTTFTAIPPATVHETVSTIDFLRITNPNG